MLHHTIHFLNIHLKRNNNNNNDNTVRLVCIALQGSDSDESGVKSDHLVKRIQFSY